MKCSLLENL